jgi:hypothetical protein
MSDMLEMDMPIVQVKAEKLNCYTVIYRDVDRELREAWHTVTDSNIEYVKNKYKKQQKEILYFVPKELPFGQFLKTIKRSSKEKK